MITAVVFDLDGVLLDSEPIWEQVRRQLVDDSGGHWPPEAQSRLMGMSTAEWSSYLSTDFGIASPPDRIAQLVIDGMADRYARRLPFIPGAPEAVRRLGTEFTLGLASSSPRRLIDTVVANAELAGRFAVTMSTEEVERGKPSPDVYLAIASRLGLGPRSCLAVEDSTNGIRSARAAGLGCVAIPQPQYPVDPGVLDQATVALATIDELTVDLVASLTA